MIHRDIIIYICTFLPDTDTNNYLSTSKEMLKLKHKVKFNNTHELTLKINNLDYYNSFTNLVMQDKKLNYNLFKHSLPKNLTKINFKILVPAMATAAESVVPKLLNCTAKEIHVTVRSSDELKLINNLLVTNLIIKHNYNRKMNTIPARATTAESVVPKSVKYLKFKSSLMHKIQPGDIPDSVLQLKIDHHYCRLLPESLPSSIIKLSVSGMFKFEIGSIPLSVTYLKTNNLSSDDYIPSSVTHCEIDCANGIEKILAPTVTHLIFSANYNGFRDIIPPNITHLTYKYPFNNCLGILPPTLTHLILPRSFNQAITNVLLPGLKYLTIPKQHEKILCNYTNLYVNYI